MVEAEAEAELCPLPPDPDLDLGPLPRHDNLAVQSVQPRHRELVLVHLSELGVECGTLAAVDVHVECDVAICPRVPVDRADC